MSYADQWTDKQLESLEKRIAEVYSEAQKDLEKTAKDYFDKFAERDEKELARLENGEITKQQYQQWRLAQIGRGERFNKLASEMAHRATATNEVAVAYVNDVTPSIYTLNYNHEAYMIEKLGFDMKVGEEFTLINEQTVKRMIMDNPDVMPYYPPGRALKRGIDLEYGQKYIKKHVTSGILQGKGVGKIADDLQRDLTNMNRASALRTARTAITSAQNGGRQATMERAVEMGIPIRKKWKCTHDSHTRHDHGKADGQTVPVDEPFIVGGEKLMHPGDTSGSGWNIYNCRCVEGSVEKEGVVVEKRQMRVRNPETGENELVEDMTYEEWARERGIKSKGKTVKATVTNKHFDVLQTDEEKIDFISKSLGVSREQAEEYEISIAQYGGFSFGKIRQASYSGGAQFDEEVYAGKLVTSFNKIAQNIEEFIEKSPKWSGEIYRGINLPHQTVKAFKNGDVIDMQGVSSWTSSYDIAETYSHKSNKTKQNQRVIFHSNGTKQGTSIKHLAYYDFEDEVLVSTKARWQIDRIEEIDGVTHLFLKELGFE